MSKMYTEHFGLREAPFSITPDPRYLYLSGRHREALAHLMYGTEEGGGFVQLTGEVGTGKTTVCRAVLSQLPDHVDVALILNPALTVPELLETICQELHMQVPAKWRRSPKQLVDALNRYLLDANARGRRTVLIVDEAQNLSTEVLEQVRLLTNLETERNKLLQIFLIGQPELRGNLSRPALRQLAQRITARYHLDALSAAETAAYIGHRLAVAGTRRRLFTARAIRRIHAYSRGIPRVINILCDRALLGAYATGATEVDVRIVRNAIRELEGVALEDARSTAWPWAAGLAVGLAALAGGWALSSHVQDTQYALGVIAPGTAEVMPPDDAVRQSRNDDAPGGGNVAARVPPEPVAEETAAVPATEPAATAMADPEPPLMAASILEPPPPGAEPLYLALASERLDATAAAAARGLITLWGETSLPGQGDVCDRVGALGLRCMHARGTWNNLRLLDRPAVLTLRHPERGPLHALVVALGPDSVSLDFGGEVLTRPLAEVDRFWFGSFWLLWRPPSPGVQVIRSGASGPEVGWLDAQLGRVEGASAAGGAGRYDTTMAQRVRQFQRSRGLAADGVVGAVTMIHLNSATASPGIPRIAAVAPLPGGT